MRRITFWEEGTYSDFAWSPDGSRIAMLGDIEGGIDLFDVVSLSLIWTNDMWVGDIIFDNDGDLLIASDYDADSISFIDATDGQVSKQILDHTCGYLLPWHLILDEVTSTLFGGLSSPTLDPDLTLVYRWDTERLECLGLFVRHTGEFNSLDLSPDGTTLLVGIYNAGLPYVAQVHLWDVASRELKCWFRSDVAAISPSGDIVAVVDHQSETLKFYDFNSCKVVIELQAGFPHPTTSYKMAFSPDGSLLAVGHRSIRIFDTSSGELLGELEIDRNLTEIAFSPDGHYLATSSCWPCTISLWSTDEEG